MTRRGPLDDNAGERGAVSVTESAEDAVARLRRELWKARQLLRVGVIAAAVLVPLAIFALPSDNLAVDVVAMLVIYPAIGGLTGGPWLYLSAWRHLRRLTRLPAARVVQRGGPARQNRAR
jgi:hypothetical protein